MAKPIFAFLVVPLLLLQLPTLKVTAVVTSCRFDLFDSPPTAEGWTATFLEGNRELGSVLAPPYVLSTFLLAGKHTFTTRWTNLEGKSQLGAATSASCPPSPFLSLR